MIFRGDIKKRLYEGRNVIIDRYAYSGVAFTAAKPVSSLLCSFCTKNWVTKNPTMKVGLSQYIQYDSRILLWVILNSIQNDHKQLIFLTISLVSPHLEFCLSAGELRFQCTVFFLD